MKNAPGRLGALLLVCLLTLPETGFAVWPQNGVGIVTSTNNQNTPKAVADGAGGAIIVWQDLRTGTAAIYAQRVDGYGMPLWTANGVAVSTPNSDLNPQLISDGAGGAIITWSRNNFDIYAQRINASGTPLWTAGGVVVCNATSDQRAPMIAPDNAGGAIIVWQDFRNPPFSSDYDIFAQRLNASGTPQWTANGVLINNAPNIQSEPQIAADGFGGAVMVWLDARSGTTVDLYAQRVNSAGTLQWSGAGVAVRTVAGCLDPYVVSDGFGGLIAGWEDYGSGAPEIIVRRLRNDGVALWAASLVHSSNLLPDVNPVLLPDGQGGVFVAWEYDNSTLLAQRMNSSGVRAWISSGVTVSPWGYDPDMVTDGLGGVIIGWRDMRTGFNDIYGQRVNGSGTPQWTANGVLLCTANNSQDSPTLVSDGVGGAIVAFEDDRTIAGVNDIYAQRIERNGYWGYPSPNIAKVRDIPGDQGGQVNVSWDASRLDPWPDELIDTYTVWRSLSPSAVSALRATGADDAIRVEEIGQTTYYWQLIHTIAAYGLTGYSDIVPTPFDSTVASPQSISFQVIAHAAVSQWVSAPLSGRSIDNLAPLAPLQLTAQRVGADVHLVWNRNVEPDLDRYAVYRKTSSGVTPIPPNFLSDAVDTVLTDANAPTSGLYYIVTAIDAHDNQSAQSNEASVSPVTGVDDTPASYTLSVFSYPNPFNPRTTVSYTLPARGHVSVTIYDTRGAHVATLFSGERAPGAYSVEWNGRGVSSGVYFARIEHNGAARAKKMVLLK